MLAAGVTYALLAPVPDDAPMPFPYMDKAIHAAMFLVVALPAMLATPRAWHWPLWALVTAFSAGLELVQPQFGRGAEWLDLLANATGAGLALGLSCVLRQRSRRSSSASGPR